MDVVGINEYIAKKSKDINIPWIGKSFVSKASIDNNLSPEEALTITREKFESQIKALTGAVDTKSYLNSLGEFAKFLNSKRIIDRNAFMLGDELLSFDGLAEAFGFQIDLMGKKLAGSLTDRSEENLKYADELLEETLGVFSQLAETLEYKDYIDAIIAEGSSAIGKVKSTSKYVTKEEIMKTGKAVYGFIANYNRLKAEGGNAKTLAQSLKRIFIWSFSRPIC